MYYSLDSTNYQLFCPKFGRYSMHYLNNYLNIYNFIIYIHNVKRILVQIIYIIFSLNNINRLQYFYEFSIKFTITLINKITKIYNNY